MRRRPYDAGAAFDVLATTLLRRERVVDRRNVQVLTRLAGEIEQSLVTERETPRIVDALERLHDAWRVP
ncbi:hypothetical protein [Burkholderia territorii]|uniref:hypothetical protein n=1 Tax=Burkholderia territorii TaxID=1503055 RepID=UPI000A9A6A57|nr:hypothetical protein [Burkholderia territorii]